jgi:hypothetical protein
MNIVLGTGTIVELVDFIIRATLSRDATAQIRDAIQTRFQISSEDADLALDRTFGGIVRASTENPRNRPDPETDPIAFESYERARRDQTIIRLVRDA